MTLSSSAVRAGDRFAWYSDQVQQYIFPITLFTPHTEDFRSEVSAFQLGAVQVAHLTFPSLRAVRTARHIRRVDPDTYQLAWVRRGAVCVTQLRNDGFIPAGGMVLFDTSHPLDTDIRSAGAAMAEVTVLRIPRGSLALPAAHTDRLLSRKLPHSGVSGALLRRHLDTLVAQASRLRPAEAHRLGAVTADLVTCFAAEALDRAEFAPPESRTAELRARIVAFIGLHLADPDLRPASIAAHHHISLRTLHTLFRQEPATVSATIRRLRLERCRADLADPRLHDLPIAALAARWGLLLPAEFSRAFRGAYGMSPGEFRAEAARVHRSARNHKASRTRAPSDRPDRRHDGASPPRAAAAPPDAGAGPPAPGL
ncbi:helix-turn-helix domain-containing protein [Streptomyces sp. NPDC018057]|uniref:AraC-like ligand-binding domain-containing protein n=1 Tax=unclassified Streptomyces TaxID=2593676 RepID=UPI0037AC6E49